MQRSVLVRLVAPGPEEDSREVRLGTMNDEVLNSCASGATVVNINDGYAGSLIRRLRPTRKSA
jgi:hypothetical protein